MREQACGIAKGAVRDLRQSWRSLALTDLAYKVLAFAMLTPGTMLLLHWLTSRAGTRVVADTDIVRFFAATPAGILALFVGGALLLAISVLDTACLMSIGFAAAKGAHMGPRDALLSGAARTPSILRLTAIVVLRVLAGLLPFLAAAGLVYLALIRGRDINYYLAQRPPAFWAAAALTALIAASLSVLLVRTIARWALALPLLIFEQVSPRRALGESARRSLGNRSLIVLVLAAYSAATLAWTAAALWLVKLIGRGAAPYIAGSLSGLLLFVAGLALVWAAVSIAVAVLNASLFSLLITRLYLHIGSPREPRVPAMQTMGRLPGASRLLSRRAVAVLAAVSVLAAIGFALLAFDTTRRHAPVAVIAHRGSSASAPENTLAAFRLAVEEGTGFVELDVQESADGEVMVVHDSDLMRAGGSAMKIWENSAAQIRTVDIGSRAGGQFSSERVPTLSDALAVCKGRTRVVIELKSYGHDQHLEDRVAQIVEAAGMGNDCIYMSLDHGMVRKMKGLRPSWQCGVLAAKAIGDLTTLDADFLAVEAKMATVGFVRRAHRAGQDVYVWTVNDPARMLAAICHGADGLITDKPALAREVVARHAAMSDAQRLLTALLVRQGASTETLADGPLRP